MRRGPVAAGKAAHVLLHLGHLAIGVRIVAVLVTVHVVRRHPAQVRRQLGAVVIRVVAAIVVAVAAAVVVVVVVCIVGTGCCRSCCCRRE